MLGPSPSWMSKLLCGWNCRDILLSALGWDSQVEHHRDMQQLSWQYIPQEIGSELGWYSPLPKSTCIGHRRCSMWKWKNIPRGRERKKGQPSTLSSHRKCIYGTCYLCWQGACGWHKQMLQYLSLHISRGHGPSAIAEEALKGTRMPSR